MSVTEEVGCAAGSQSALRAEGMSKDYGSVRVVCDVTVDFQAGSIHALLGENGAGKSTLIKMLSGVIRPTEGEILVAGRRQQLRSVREAQAFGVVALPQELTLVPTLGAAENIFLGLRRPGMRGLVNRRRLDSDAAEQLERLGQDIPLDVPVGELSAVQQTMIALARALARDARVLILDEPTAALTDSETDQLFAVLRRLRDAGTAIVYVSHRLEEVFALADTATILRNGRLIWTKPIDRTDTADVVSAMIGREHGQVYPPRATVPGPVMLEVDGLSGHRIREITLTVSAGEVVGIAGLAGAGRSELLKIIAGAERAQNGTIRVAGVDVTDHSLRRSMDAGIALVPEERRSQGLVMTDSVEANIAMADLKALSSFGIVRSGRVRGVARRRADELRIRATSVRQPVDELSGGNQQKVVLAKFLQRTPRILLLDEPTRGIDIGTKAEIYHLVRALTREGVAVLVVSSEIPELIGLADRILVLNEGRLTGTVPAAGTTEEEILGLCYRKAV